MVTGTDCRTFAVGRAQSYSRVQRDDLPLHLQLGRIHDAGRGIHGTFAGWGVIPYLAKQARCTWVSFSIITYTQL